MSNLKNVRAGLKKDIQDAISAYNSDLKTIAALKIRAENLQTQTLETQYQLEAKENELKNV